MASFIHTKVSLAIWWFNQRILPVLWVDLKKPDNDIWHRKNDREGTPSEEWRRSAAKILARKKTRAFELIIKSKAMSPRGSNLVDSDRETGEGKVLMLGKESTELQQWKGGMGEEADFRISLSMMVGREGKKEQAQMQTQGKKGRGRGDSPLKEPSSEDESG